MSKIVLWHIHVLFLLTEQSGIFQGEGWRAGVARAAGADAVRFVSLHPGANTLAGRRLHDAGLLQAVSGSSSSR